MIWHGYKTGKAISSEGDNVVLQIVLIEKFLGTGSGTASLFNLQAAINKLATLAYGLILLQHHLLTLKGLGGDKIKLPWCLKELIKKSIML